MKTIGYVRVSTEEQAQDGVSLEAQRFSLREAAAARDLPLLRIHSDEGLSGKTLDRPGLRAALDDLRTGAGSALMVTRLDRLSRDDEGAAVIVREHFTASKRRAACTLISLSEMVDTRTAMGRFSLRQYFSMAMLEREVIAERTTAALAQLQRQGQYLGRVPYGYRLDKNAGHLVPEAAEQAVLAEVAAWRAGGSSLETIAAELNARGITGARGGKWTATSVSRALGRAAPPASPQVVVALA